MLSNILKIKVLEIMVASAEPQEEFLVLRHSPTKTYMRYDGTLSKDIIPAEEFWGDDRYKKAKAFAKKYGYKAYYMGSWWLDLVATTFKLYAAPKLVRRLSWGIPVAVLILGGLVLKAIL